MVVMSTRFEVQWEGREYVFSPEGFYDARTFLKPPEAIHQHLKAAYARELRLIVRKVHHVPALLKHSGLAKKLGYFDLAEEITERALLAEPNNRFAIARLSSILRAKGQPGKALAVIARVPERIHDHQILTSKAAALCDLERLPEADSVIRRALGMLKDRPRLEATEALSVFQRIQHSWATVAVP
jgi:tetratricopeptide (TPR) repeat protein